MILTPADRFFEGGRCIRSHPPQFPLRYRAEYIRMPCRPRGLHDQACGQQTGSVAVTGHSAVRVTSLSAGLLLQS